MLTWNTPAPADEQRRDPAEVFAAGIALHHLANTAYPIGHVQTMRGYRLPNSQVESAAAAAWDGIQRLSLYVHIPFCEARCGFCEYTVIDPALNQASQSPYFDLLVKEFELYRQAAGTDAKTLEGFDIGGGTPAVAEPRQIEAVLRAAQRSFHLPETVQISIETTPKLAAQQPDKLIAYRQMGIRRISMGVQTVNPRLLELVGRSATSLAWNQAAAEAVRLADFERFNIDVMYGFANQSLASVEATLAHVLALQPDYVTLYRMRYKGTRLVQQAAYVTLEQVNQQHDLLRTMLLAAGYAANPGKNTYSRISGEAGTSDYLTGRVERGVPYLGLGLGAQSLSEYTLSYNTGAADKALRRYAQKVNAGELPVQDIYHLSQAAAMAKMISVAFYFGEIQRAAFVAKFGVSLEQAFPAETAFVLANGLMELTPTSLRLTEHGAKHFNGVVALFYAGAVQQYLLDTLAAEQQAIPLNLPAVRQPSLAGAAQHG